MNYRAWGIPAVLSRGIPGKVSSERVSGRSSGIFPGISLPESPSRTGGMAQIVLPRVLRKIGGARGSASERV